MVVQPRHRCEATVRAAELELRERRALVQFIEGVAPEVLGGQLAAYAVVGALLDGDGSSVGRTSALPPAAADR